MKVNRLNENEKTSIRNIAVGSVFSAARSSIKDEIGIYMKINMGNKSSNSDSISVLAINLETGQVRHFSPYTKILPRKAEVSVCMGGDE